MIPDRIIVVSNSCRDLLAEVLLPSFLVAERRRRWYYFLWADFMTILYTIALFTTNKIHARLLNFWQFSDLLLVAISTTRGRYKIHHKLYLKDLLVQCIMKFQDIINSRALIYSCSGQSIRTFKYFFVKECLLCCWKRSKQIIEILHKVRSKIS